jgi:hypothetical protein
MASLQLSDGMWQRLKEIGMDKMFHRVNRDRDLQGIVMALIFQPGLLDEREEEIRMMMMLRRPMPYTVSVRNGTFSVT